MALKVYSWILIYRNKFFVLFPWLKLNSSDKKINSTQFYKMTTYTFSGISGKMLYFGWKSFLIYFFEDRPFRDKTEIFQVLATLYHGPTLNIKVTIVLHFNFYIALQIHHGAVSNLDLYPLKCQSSNSSTCLVLANE